MEPRALVEQVFREAIAAVSPRTRTAVAVGELAAAGELGAPVVVLAMGKAAASMAAGARDALGPRLSSGLVVVKDEIAGAPHGLDVRVAAHPWPDARSLAAGEELLRRAAAVPESGTLLVLVSGGASALACVPAAGVPFEDKLIAVRLLADAGAPIGELNALRKHLSAVKGGQLAAVARARLHALVWSDVLGDDPSVVGGGPVSPDPSTFADAAAGLRVRKLWAATPASVRERLERGERREAGAPEETPKPGATRLLRARVRVLAGPDDLLAAASAASAALGVRVVHVEPHVADPVEALAPRLSARTLSLAWRLGPGEAAMMIAGGEPTVRLPPRCGRGGRAQHVAWLVASELWRMKWPDGTRAAVLCAGSDGSDGPTGDAGGVVDAASWTRAGAAGVDPARALTGFDSGHALAAAGDLLTIGPTGNNLGDLFMVCAARAPGSG